MRSPCPPAGSTRPRVAFALFGGVTRIGGPTRHHAPGQQFQGEAVDVARLGASYRFAFGLLDEVFIHSWAHELAAELTAAFAPVASVFERNAERLGAIRRRLHPAFHSCPQKEFGGEEHGFWCARP